MAFEQKLLRCEFEARPESGFVTAYIEVNCPQGYSAKVAFRPLPLGSIGTLADGVQAFSLSQGTETCCDWCGTRIGITNRIKSQILHRAIAWARGKIKELLRGRPQLYLIPGKKGGVPA